MPSAPFAGITFPKDYPIQIIGDGYMFHLGNRDLETILLGNHTKGGTAYLDRKQRILFVGDEIMAQQGIPIRVSVEQFEKIQEKLAAHRKEFDTLCAGWEMMDASWIDKYLAVSQYVLAGHQGLPVADAPPAGKVTNWRSDVPAVDPTGAGRTVYNRHIPRGGGGGRGRGPADPNMYRITLNGATITYDIRKIHD
jgi:glyoxylase-like metal-dependent hydrolase (beta-lactamase superfamily II)